MAVVTPKFLTRDLIEKAVDLVINGVFLSNALDGIAKPERVGHVVVFVPGVEHRTGTVNIVPMCIFEKSFNRDMWKSPYSLIAMSKATQLWTGQNTDGATSVMPHLLMPGDTPYWGGVKRDGIVVAFSGDKSTIDQMISGMVADAIKALAYIALDESDDKRNKVAFLS